MKRPTMLIEALLKQFSIDLGLSVERDVLTIRRRIEHEGFSFLALTLPTLSEALEQGLESGLLSCPTNFSRHGSLPRLLGGFFSRVFERSGELRQDADPDSIRAIRQICSFFKKPKIACSGDREVAAEARFIEVEKSLSMLTPQIMRKDILLDKICRIIWSQVLPEPNPDSLVCHHGPGVTADRYLSNERYRIRSWYDRWEGTFPADLHAVPNFGYCFGDEAGGGPQAGISGIDYLQLSDEPSVRVVFVPKTMASPRVIAIEPSVMQFVQQGLLDYIVPLIEGHSLTKSSIRFTDQGPNQRLAHKASIDQGLATLDLKEASDRVHFLLVRRILQGTNILAYFEDARSLHATLPSGKNIVLHKYASMGSALCFPTMAMVIFTLLQSIMHSVDNVRPSNSSIQRYSRKIDVYGDDIIIPTHYADAAIQYLESYGLKVNVNKSFLNGFFRESCGADFYKGTPVRPVYARQMAPDLNRDWSAHHVMAWVSTANQFYEAGMWCVAQVVRDMLQQVLRYPIPRCRSDGEGVFFKSFLFDTNLQYNRDLCGWKQRRIVYQPTKKKDDIDGNAIACLNKWGLSGLHDHTDGIESLHRFGVDLSSRFGTRSPDDDPDESLLGEPLPRVQPSGSEWPMASSSLRGLGSGDDSRSIEARSRDGMVGTEYGFEQRSRALVRGLKHTSREILQILPSGRTVGLDFSSSVKRGGFKPRRRWVSIPS